ncbi:diguanylate cyclase/phosphodiesterase (GGDEF & EAL domains) with PAS/PAC sensor(s) [hydrothermal vent metagenome]|uniref:Diguanylate cyclase/phosphodiesterase (GGDEF & EAL domains) with PAS/PAC sensor(S) n=1 Tax=hydrothermal vent metagenome TaxID=652676 RepID=A0A3B1DNK5_9ZZZZ
MSEPRDTPHDTPDTPHNHTLSALDIEALDALIEAGMEAERLPETLRPRALHVAGLLGLLDAGSVEDRKARISRVLEALQLAREETSSAIPEAVELSLNDAEALDAWVLAGFDPARVPASLRARARAHDALAGLVRAGGPISSDFARTNLIERTMARLEQPAEAAEESYPFVGASGRNRWADILSVAAMMLIAASILWPVLGSVRNSSRQTICASNMRGVAMAMGSYTNDQDEMLPMATAGFGGGTWWNVGRDPSHSNSANLYTLARENYLGLDSLACPGNPQAIAAPRSPEARDWSSLEEISYSYRVMARPEQSLWGTPSQLVIVADRSPVVLRAVRGQVIYPLESSPNHRGQGQHGLFADGSARWLTTPMLESGDNIWLPKPVEMLIDLAARQRGLDPLQGTEAPADRQDSFVGP